MAESVALRCVHCGRAVDETTKDHVFPASWYPESTPEDIQRWTAPSCGACNNRLGSIEKKVFSRLILCVDPRVDEAAGLSARVMRSLGVGVEGLSEEEADHRRRQKLGLMAAITPHNPETAAHTLPGLGSHAGFKDEDLSQIAIPADLLHQVSCKIVRGCEYVLAHRVIEAPLDIEIHFVLDHDLQDDLVRAFRSYAANDVSVGPGFRVIRIALRDAPELVAYKVTLWGTVTFHASILEVEAIAPAKAN